MELYKHVALLLATAWPLISPDPLTDEARGETNSRKDPDCPLGGHGGFIRGDGGHLKGHDLLPFALLPSRQWVWNTDRRETLQKKISPLSH